MGSLTILRVLQVALLSACARALTTLSAAGDDSDCALYLNGPGRTSAYDYSLNLLKGNFNYEGQHTCITYDAINQAYLEARNRIVVSQPKGDWKAEDFASVGELILDISINLARRYGLTYEEIEKGLPLIDTSRTLIRDVCPPVFSHVECRAGKYRRLDGLCNNLQHPTWGSTMSPFQRLIGPLFADGINAPRIAHTGHDLPLSRVVSRTMHPDDGFHDHAGTVMVIAWGQFMDHDYTLTGTPLDPINRNDPEECCKRPPHLKHPYCNEIRIPDDDYFYRLWNVKCIDFVRAFPSPRPGCRLGSRVPFNTLTGVIDGNTVYGVTDKFSRKLRTGFGGLLRMNPVFKEYGLKDLLPLKLDIPDEGCTRPNKNMYCFEAGEIRVNEQLVLTVMHTLMAREHNRIAGALAEVNPHWDDETLFQESRRINIAEIQHITYNEFLPILLGKDVMEKFGLVLEKEGYWDGYDQDVNPDVIDSFASAAFRFGHSLLPTAVERWSKAHKFIASKRLSDLIRRPYDLYRAGVLDEYVMGLMNQVAQAMDDSITQEVTNHLFKKVGARFGMDLVSFNMQRGREFGIPGYMEFRKFCGLAGANTFQDLFGSMPNETVRKYETIFEHPVDVDLWSGGVSERPLPGSMLGPTFACVIATQFSYSRRGDRFWFELPNQPSSFTPEQLAEVRKARLARVICDNTDIIDTVQLYPMVLPDHELNPRVPCRSGILPSIDFSKWAEPAPFHGPKPFVTDAYVSVNNGTGDLLNGTENNKSQIIMNVTNGENTHNTKTITENKPEVLTVVKSNLNIQNTEIPNVKNCTEDVKNCPNNHTKTKESYGTDKILKYVYKKDDKVNTPTKTGSHFKNSIKRRKRSTNIPNNNRRNPTNAPLIVNYETIHGPPVGPSYLRNTGNIIKSADLADLNIVTVHGNEPYNKEIHSDKMNADNDRSKSAETEEYNVNNKNNSSNEDENSTERDDHSNKLNTNSNENSDESSDDENSTEKGEHRDESHEDDKPKGDDSIEQNEKQGYSKVNPESKESYREQEREVSRSGETTSNDSRESNENGDKTFYKGRAEQSVEKSGYTESYPHENKHNDDITKYPASKEKQEFRDDRSHENDESLSSPSRDSNESRQSSEESSSKQESVEKYHDNDDSRLPYRRPQGHSNSESNDKNSLENSSYHKENFKVPHSNKDHENEKDNYHVNPTQPESEEEEEAIIAIMKKKKRKPHDKPRDDYRAEDSEYNNHSLPIKIRDVDLGDFTFETIQVNEKGAVEPVQDTHENYDVSLKETPLKTFQPESEHISDSSSSESSAEDKKPVHIDDGEVKPVIEYNSDREDSNEESSKEALKANPTDDTSLETLLGVKNPGSDEKSDKIIASQEEQDRGDVKQQFERIPLNYNHAQKGQDKKESNNDPTENSLVTKNSNSGFYPDAVDVVITPKVPVKYDEHLNFKFDDVSIKLPEIKLPEDILDFPYEEPTYSYIKKEKSKNKNPKKDKFFHYNENEYNDDHSYNPKRDDHEPDYYNDHYGKNSKKENYKKKEEHAEEDDEDEDLYEKFVRERFGKRSVKKSERFSSPTRPAVENEKLFAALQSVLKKAENIEEESQKSGDPKAGYIWTVEYGQKL